MSWIISFFKSEKTQLDRATKILTTVRKDIEDFMECEDLNKHGFDEYGIGIDYVEPHTFVQQPYGYHRYKITSSTSLVFNIRFHNGGIEAVYLDYNGSLGFDISGQKWAIWLKEIFKERGMLEIPKIDEN